MLGYIEHRHYWIDPDMFDIDLHAVAALQRMFGAGDDDTPATISLTFDDMVALETCVMAADAYAHRQGERALCSLTDEEFAEIDRWMAAARQCKFRSAYCPIRTAALDADNQSPRFAAMASPPSPPQRPTLNLLSTSYFLLDAVLRGLRLDRHATYDHCLPCVVPSGHGSLRRRSTRARFQQTVPRRGCCPNYNKGRAIRFTGVCTGPVVIATEGVTLQGVGAAVIDGAGEDGVTIVGAGRVTLSGIEVRNGRYGILGVNGAHVSLSAINVHDNLASGISMRTASCAQ